MTIGTLLPALSEVARHLALAALLLIAPATLAAPAWGQKELMTALAQVKDNRVSFTETKYISALKAPLVSSGVLTYHAPNRLEKRVTTPYQETTLIVADRVTIENKTRRYKRNLDIKSNPAIGAFVESFRATLAGDIAALERFYKLDFQGDRQQWQLTLLPRDVEMGQLIRSIVIDGYDIRIVRITTHEADGDRSVLSLSELNF